MNKYESKNRHYFIGALFSILISTIFAVYLQFFKGDVLDYAVIGDTSSTLHYGSLLLVSILCEILFYFVYRQFSARFVIGCTRYLKQDIFGHIFHRSFVSYKEYSQGEYLAKYTNETDTIKERRFNMLPMFWEILFKIIIVSIALFLLDPRIAVITIVLLTTPLYIPKLIEKPLQKAQTQSIQSVEEAFSKVNDWFAGFEIIKNYSIEKKILSSFQIVNDNAMDKSLKETQLGAVSQLISTLISYLYKGSILVDGNAITDFSSTYGCITVVRQEAILFHDTLRNNLTMYHDIAEETLLQILTDVGLEKLANVNSLDSLVEEGGVNFSGGEKKRICLARALLRDTDMLILDEPLANLDVATAERIEDLLLSIENKTLLVVSHQFSSEKLSAFAAVVDFSE